MKPLRRIYSENPYQKIWDTFVYFESEPTTKEFLQNTYKKKGIKDSFKYAFQNTSKFIYFIKQAREYFLSADHSNILVKPLLLYYGMMSLIKAVILTYDPEYPNKTGVLRHGITTRKLKKSNYQFHDDEIKIQKEGLLPLFYTLMTNHSVEKIEGNKYKIKELLSHIPELNQSYFRLFNEKTIFPIKFIDINHNQPSFTVSNDILKRFSNSKALFINQLKEFSSNKNLEVALKDVNDNQLLINWNNTTKNPMEFSDIFMHSMFIQDIKGNYYVKPINESRFLIPETMIEYMLMYNLGMLCRYETELWGEIIFSFTSEDMYIINELVNITLRKFPNIILNYLFDEFLIFVNH